MATKLSPKAQRPLFNPDYAACAECKGGGRIVDGLPRAKRCKPCKGYGVVARTPAPSKVRYLYTFVSHTGIEIVLGAYASDATAQRGAWLFTSTNVAPLRQHEVQPGERIVRGSRYMGASR